MRAARSALPALSALLATVAATAPSASAAAEPELRGPTKVGNVVAWAPSAGTARLVVDVGVRHGALSPRAVAVEHRHRVRNLTRVTVRAGGAARTVRAQLPLAERGVTRHRVVLAGAGARRALRAVSDGTLAVRVRVRTQVAVAGEGITDRARARGRRRVELRRPARAPRAAAPRCERFAQLVPYATRLSLAAVCSGHRVRFRIVGGPRNGGARVTGAAAGRAELAYRPAARYVGRDRIVLSARAAGGATTRLAIPLTVAPPKLRALGDSVTAGFGFIGDSGEMSVEQFPDCIPPDQPNDQCSSNSASGPSSTNSLPDYLPDFGLSNGIAWPAQFAQARGLTGPGMYENRAVSGSTPAQWADGYLQAQLQAIVADSPNLTVLTLGANPLLDTFLGGPGLACDAANTDALFIACIQAFVTNAGLQPNLISVIEQLLAAPGNRIVVSQYHLSMPSLALAAEYTPHRLELMATVLNHNVAAAVQAVGGYGERVFTFAPPRFDVGIAPGATTCPGQAFQVDGPSRQSTAAQLVLASQNPQFCPTFDPWIISADDGIHPNAAGYAQFAAALETVVDAEGLLPAPPR